MTVKQIAEATGKKERVVHNWVKSVSAKNAEVSAKIAQARATSRPADYTQYETIAIIREGMGEVPAGVYQANTETAKPTQMLNGTQLREFRMIYGPEEAAKRIDMLIGFSGGQSYSPEIVTVPVANNLGEISKQAYAVEMKVRKQQRAKQIEERNNRELFD